MTVRSMPTTRDQTGDGPATTETATVEDDPAEDGEDAEGDTDADSAERGVDHLSDVPDGCGCAETWAVTSERRAE